MRTRTSSIVLIISMLIVVGTAVLPPAYSNEDARKREIKMGREAAREIQKDAKFVTDPDIVERVESLGQSIAAVANSESVAASYGKSEIYQFEYKFKVLDDDDVNAMSLPGGFVYVNKGLLDYVESDHELAGVLAHEVAHSAHHHMTYLLKKQSKLDSQIALLLLAGMLTRVDASDLGNLLIGVQLVKIAKTSGYGQKAEADADATATAYVTKAGYNPVGILTFLERLARDHATMPSVDMGILQTHPAPRDRCKATMDQIRSLGLPINRRAVTNALKAVTEPSVVGDQEIVRVKLGESILFEPAPIGNTLTSEQRAEAIVTKVNQLLDSEPVFREVTLSPDGRTVLARGEPIIVATPQDGDLLGKPADEIAAEAAMVLKRAIWGEMIRRLY